MGMGHDTYNSLGMGGVPDRRGSATPDGSRRAQHCESDFVVQYSHAHDEAGEAQVVVIESALKHGLSEEDVSHAWRNAFATATRLCDDGRVDLLAVGMAPDGKVVELVASEYAFGVVVFHANTPVSQRMMAELNLAGK